MEEFILKKCLRFFGEWLPLSATTGPYNSKKWKNFFKGGIYDHTEEDWQDVITGCNQTFADEMKPSILVKDARYFEFVENKPDNFFKGIEQAFQAIKDSSLIEESFYFKGIEDRNLRKGIYVPFTNASGDRFVVLVLGSRKKPCAHVYNHYCNQVWEAETSYLYEVVLFPKQADLASVSIKEKQYLYPRAELLAVSATTGPYNSKKWEQFFSQLDDLSIGREYMITGCNKTFKTKIQVNDITEDGKYGDFIENKPRNFFKGIEQAFQVLEDNPPLLEEVFTGNSYDQIHVPFTNKEGHRFIAQVQSWYGPIKPNVEIFDLQEYVWNHGDNRKGSLVLFPVPVSVIHAQFEHLQVEAKKVGARLHLIENLIVDNSESHSEAIMACGPQTKTDDIIFNVANLYRPLENKVSTKTIVLMSWESGGKGYNKAVKWGLSNGLHITAPNVLFATGKNFPKLNEELKEDIMFLFETTSCNTTDEIPSACCVWWYGENRRCSLESLESTLTGGSINWFAFDMDDYISTKKYDDNLKHLREHMRQLEADL